MTIIMTQLPSLFGTAGGGHNFFERAILFAGQLGDTHYLALAVGLIAIGLLMLGDRVLPGKPVALAVVALFIVAASVLGLPALGLALPGKIPPGFPSLEGPALRLRTWRGLFRWRPDACCSPISRACPPRAPLLLSMATLSTRGRSSSVSARQTSRRRWGKAIR